VNYSEKNKLTNKFKSSTKASVIPASKARRESFLKTKKDSGQAGMTEWGYFYLFRNIILLFSLFTVHCSLFTSISYAVEPPKRIISLAPNLTEILFELGLGDRIIGVTTFCDYPEEAKKKPKVGGMSNPSLEAVVSMKPDIVVMTTDGNPKEFETRLRSLGIKTYIFKQRRLPELPAGIRDLGLVLGEKEKAEEIAKYIETGLNAFNKTRNAQPVTSKKVLFIVWPEPLIVAGPGTLIDDAIKIIGKENIASKAKASYPKYSIEEVLRQSPDIIFIGRGKGMEKVSQGLMQRLKSLPAVKNRRVFYVSDYLYRLGPRTLMGVEEIAGLVEKNP
jgi:iron complex transport system substrate-binding protein